MLEKYKISKEANSIQINSKKEISMILLIHLVPYSKEVL